MKKCEIVYLINQNSVTKVLLDPQLGRGDMLRRDCKALVNVVATTFYIRDLENIGSCRYLILVHTRSRVFETELSMP